jgi:ankyrin repeat protein
VRALLVQGAEVNATDNGGRTALHWACASADHGAIAQLLAFGADATLRTLETPPVAILISARACARTNWLNVVAVAATSALGFSSGSEQRAFFLPKAHGVGSLAAPG